MAQIISMERLETLPVLLDDVRRATSVDTVLSRVITFMRSGWPGIILAKSLKPFKQRYKKMSIEEGCLMWSLRAVIPLSLRSRVLQELHESHTGTSRMKSLARMNVRWPNCDRDTEKSWISFVSICQTFSSSSTITAVHLDVETLGYSSDKLCGSFLGKTFLVITNAYSKWPEVFQMRSTDTRKTIEVLRKSFGAYRLPKKIPTNNGPQFISKKFCDFVWYYDIQHIKSAPYHP